MFWVDVIGFCWAFFSYCCGDVGLWWIAGGWRFALRVVFGCDAVIYCRLRWFLFFVVLMFFAWSRFGDFLRFFDWVGYICFDIDFWLFLVICGFVLCFASWAWWCFRGFFLLSLWLFWFGQVFLLSGWGSWDSFVMVCSCLFVGAGFLVFLLFLELIVFCYLGFVLFLG